MQHRWGWACACDGGPLCRGMDDGHVERVDGTTSKKGRRRVEEERGNRRPRHLGGRGTTRRAMYGRRQQEGVKPFLCASCPVSSQPSLCLSVPSGHHPRVCMENAMET